MFWMKNSLNDSKKLSQIRYRRVEPRISAEFSEAEALIPIL
jgi:hypothetical protein